MVRVQRDDGRAFEVLYDRHRSAVFWLAMRFLDDRGLAADVTQEAFIVYGATVTSAARVGGLDRPPLRRSGATGRVLRHRRDCELRGARNANAIVSRRRRARPL